jgi:hypothetical protein
VLKLKCDGLLSKIAFKFNLRRYNMVDTEALVARTLTMADMMDTEAMVGRIITDMVDTAAALAAQRECAVAR